MELRLEDAKRQNEMETERAAAVGKNLGPMQELSRQLLAVLRQAQKLNAEVIRLNDEFSSVTRRSGIELHRPLVSMSFRSLGTILEVLESEVRGSGRPLSIYPKNFPI